MIKKSDSVETRNSHTLVLDKEKYAKLITMLGTEPSQNQSYGNELVHNFVRNCCLLNEILGC